MNTRRLFLTSLLATGLVAGSAAYAGPGGHCKYGKHGKHGGAATEMMQNRMNRIAEKLGLDDIQKQRMKELMTSYRNHVKPLHQQKREISKQMRSLDPAAEDYLTQFGELANKKADLVRQMTIAKGEKRKAMFLILNPEQREQLKQMRSQHRKYHHRGYKGE